MMQMKFRIGQIADIFNNDDLRDEMLHVQHFCNVSTMCGYSTLKKNVFQYNMSMCLMVSNLHLEDFN